jgi:uncharacterized protein DUF2516
LVDYLGDMLIKTLTIGTLILAVWALIDAAIRPTPTYVSAGKLTKPAWLAITGASVALALLFPLLSMFRLAGLVASIVYLVDVRPAIKESQGGSRW